MIFDTHVHVFPSKLVGKVFGKLSEISSCEHYRDESLTSAMDLLKRGGGTHCLTLHIATNPAQMQAVNNFAAEIQGGNVLSFGSVHPKAENAVKELYRIKDLGLKGIKLHPDYQEFMADSGEMDDIYGTCEKLGLIVAFHTGLDPYSKDLVHCPPCAVRNIANSFTRLKIIAAHMGGMNRKDEFESDLAGCENVYIDTAMASTFIKPGEMRRLARLHGTERVLFATDSPWSTMENERNLVENAGFTKGELEGIYFENAMGLLK